MNPDAEKLWRSPKGGKLAAVMMGLRPMGDEEQAAHALSQVPAKIAEHAEIVGARSALALAVEGRKAANLLGEYEHRLAQHPEDHQARYDFATALNSLDRRAEAADALLAIIRADRGWNEDAARLQLLKFFEAWGFADPATLAARRKLSAMLFS